MTTQDCIADKRDRSIDTARRNVVVPQLFAGTWLETIDAAIAAANNQLSLSVDDRNCWRTVRCIFGKRASALEPDGLTIPLIERNDAVSRTSHFAPANHDTADDDQILMNDREVGSAPIGAQQAIFFAHRM